MKSPLKSKDNSKKERKDDKTVLNSGFFGKLSDMFSPEPQKEKVLRREDFTAAGDTYYATVSVGYKIMQRIIVLILAIFLIFSLITNFREITYDNLFYLLKDFSTAVDMESANYDTLSYDSNTNHFFSLFRGGLTVVNSSNISVFTATGRRTMNIQSAFSSPCVESSGKYFIIYDTSGNTFSVYNSFSRIFTQTLAYPVTGACFADNGYMAVITRDISHKSMVNVYNKNFKILYTVPSDKYAYDVDMSSKADRLAVSYYGIGDGSGTSEIRILSLSTAQDLESITIAGEFLLKCGFISDSVFAVITNKSIRIYDKNFEEIESVQYYNSAISGYSINEHGAAVSYTYNSTNVAVVFDSSGKLLYNESFDSNIKDIDIFDGYIFIRTDDGVLRVNGKNASQEFLSSGQGRLLIYNANTALVCGDSKAEYLVFSEK